MTYCYDDGSEPSVGYDRSDAVTAIRVTAPAKSGSSPSPLQPRDFRHNSTAAECLGVTGPRRV